MCTHLLVFEVIRHKRRIDFILHVSHTIFVRFSFITLGVVQKQNKLRTSSIGDSVLLRTNFNSRRHPELCSFGRRSDAFHVNWHTTGSRWRFSETTVVPVRTAYLLNASTRCGFRTVLPFVRLLCWNQKRQFKTTQGDCSMASDSVFTRPTAYCFRTISRYPCQKDSIRERWKKPENRSRPEHYEYRPSSLWFFQSIPTKLEEQHSQHSTRICRMDCSRYGALDRRTSRNRTVTYEVQRNRLKPREMNSTRRGQRNAPDFYFTSTTTNNQTCGSTVNRRQY